MFSFLYSKWWVLGIGMRWQQWARLEEEGKVGIYDNEGKIILKTKYRSRFRAAASLKRRGFRKVRRTELKKLQPPQPDNSNATREATNGRNSAVKFR